MKQILKSIVGYVLVQLEMQIVTKAVKETVASFVNGGMTEKEALQRLSESLNEKTGGFLLTLESISKIVSENLAKTDKELIYALYKEIAGFPQDSSDAEIIAHIYKEAKGENI